MSAWPSSRLATSANRSFSHCRTSPDPVHSGVPSETKATLTLPSLGTAPRLTPQQQDLLAGVPATHGLGQGRGSAWSTECSLRSARPGWARSPTTSTGTLARAASLDATLPSRRLDSPAPLAPTTSRS